MREGSSTRDRLFEERAIVSSILDQSIDDTCELGSDRTVPLAVQINIQRVSTHVTIELAAQTVLAHAHRALAAIQNAVRSLALPYLESRLMPRKRPDC